MDSLFIRREKYHIHFVIPVLIRNPAQPAMNAHFAPLDTGFRSMTVVMFARRSIIDGLYNSIAPPPRNPPIWNARRVATSRARCDSNP